MSNKNEKLKVDLIKTKPNKVFRVTLNYGYQIKELCNFLKSNKDKVVSVVINGKHTKFNSIASKKRFAEGYQLSSSFIFDYALKIVKEAENKVAGLEKELSKTKQVIESNKKETRTIKEQLATNNVVKKLRQEAYADDVAELNEDREFLSERLKKVEPVIRLILKSETAGQLQAAYKLAKKSKL